MKVGPPPIRPSRARKAHDGRTLSADIGATMPKPSVALWSPKPMISTNARLISPFAADWPIARPSEKLWNPMPTAMRRASREASWARVDDESRCVRPTGSPRKIVAPAMPPSSTTCASDTDVMLGEPNNGMQKPRPYDGQDDGEDPPARRQLARLPRLLRPPHRPGDGV